MRKEHILVFFLVFLLVSIQADSKSHWGYEGEAGPKHWGEIKADYHICGSGTHQSPVNIENVALTESLEKLEIVYQKSEKMSMLNNGHTVQCNYPEGSYLQIGSKKYHLLQFHFHTPSEHTLEGESSPMEVHLVHRSKSGELAVIGIFFKVGEHNPFLRKVIPHFPKKIKSTEKKKSLDIRKLLPSNLSYFTYSGSLTTPPCSEGVRWIVLQTPLEASEKQIAKLHKIMGKNARPTQDLKGRVIQGNPPK